MAHKPHSSSHDSIALDKKWRKSCHERLEKFFQDPTCRNIGVYYSRTADAELILRTFQCGKIRGEKFLQIPLQELRSVRRENGTLDTDALRKKLDCILERHISSNSNRVRNNRIRLFFFMLLCVFFFPLVEACSHAVGFPDEYISQIGNVLCWVLIAIFLYNLLTVTKVLDIIPSFSLKLFGLEGAISFGTKDYGSNKFLKEVSKDLVYISRRYHRTVVFAGLSELAPEVRDALLAILKDLNMCANKANQDRSRLRKIWYGFLGKAIPIPPIRFLYSLKYSSESPSFSDALYINAYANSTNVGALFRNRLRKVIAITSDDLDYVCERICSTISDWEVLQSILACFCQWKSLCEDKLSRMSSEEYAKLLSLAAYHQLDSCGFYKLDTGPCVDTIPITEPPELDPMHYEMLVNLRARRYLDPTLLRYLNGTDSPSSPDLITLMKGKTEHKIRILKSRLYAKSMDTDCDDLRCQIESEELLLREPDSNVALLLAEYLDIPAQKYLERLLVCLSHRCDPFYNLYHPSGYFNALKLTAARDSHLVETSRLHGEFYFKNTLLALSRFSDEELQTVLQLVNRDELLHHLHLWMDLYYFSAYHPMHWRNVKRWDSNWDACVRVLLICLNCDQNTISRRLKHKRFGKKTLQQHMYTN